MDLGKAVTSILNIIAMGNWIVLCLINKKSIHGLVYSRDEHHEPNMTPESPERSAWQSRYATGSSGACREPYILIIIDRYAMSLGSVPSLAG